MTHCGSPGMCGKQMSCPDRHCEGHPRNSDEALYERTRRVQAEDHRWRQDIGVEAADAARVTGTPIVTDELRPVREPIDWQAVAIWASVALCVTAIAWLSIADPRDLSTIWPRLVSLASF